MSKKAGSSYRRLGNVYGVVLIGGKGKRLRPLSTDSRPKAFISIARNRKTMFENTIRRLEKLIAPGNILVVANKAHARLVKEEFPGIKRNRLILEPVSRNTAPAIALAAWQLRDKGHNAVMVVLPTDHYVPDEEKQRACLAKGIHSALKGESGFVVLGLKPKGPSTGFGYIKIKKGAGAEKGNCRVERFVEKPHLARARRYVASGKYLWNTGVFIFRVAALIEAIKEHAPEIYSCLKRAGAQEGLYEKMPDVSIDYAIMEKVKGIRCVRGSYRWSDVGSFDSLKKVLRRESRRFVAEDGKVLKILP